MVTLSMPQCLNCKKRWLSMVDLRAEQKNSKKKTHEYISSGDFNKDLQELVTLTQLKTMKETADHLRNAQSTFSEIHKDDGTMSPVIRAINDVIQWMDNWYTQVEKDFREKQAAAKEEKKS